MSTYIKYGSRYHNRRGENTMKQGHPSELYGLHHRACDALIHTRDTSRSTSKLRQVPSVHPANKAGRYRYRVERFKRRFAKSGK